MNNTPGPKSYREGDYLTDQQRLFRVVQVVPAKLNRRAAILEDCRTLETVLFGPRDLRRMRLELVRRPAADTVEPRAACEDGSPVPVLD